MIKCIVMNKHIVSEIEMEDEANDRSFGEKNITDFMYTIFTYHHYINYISYPQYEKKMQL